MRFFILLPRAVIARWSLLVALATTWTIASSCSDPESSNAVTYVPETDSLRLLAASSQACTPAPADMVRWFPAEGTADELVNGKNGSFVGGSAAFASGKVGQAFSFFDGSAWVNAPDEGLPTSGAMTIEYWVNQQENARIATFIGQEFSGGPETNLYIINGIGPCLGYFGAGAYCGTTNIVGAWHHVAITYDGVGLFRFYIDGNLERMDINYNGIPDEGDADGIYRPGQNTVLKGVFHLGNSWRDPAYDRQLEHFLGQIDEFSIYSRALTQSEIQAIARAGNAGKCRPNFRGFFQPVENPGTAAPYIFNAAKPGSAIPVKFTLGGDQGLDIFRPGSPGSQAVSCVAGAPEDIVEETVTANSSGLTYDPSIDQYNYVWKTSSSWANSCRKLSVALKYGSTYEALFHFTK